MTNGDDEAAQEGETAPTPHRALVWAYSVLALAGVGLVITGNIIGARHGNTPVGGLWAPGVLEDDLGAVLLGFAALLAALHVTLALVSRHRTAAQAQDDKSSHVGSLIPRTETGGNGAPADSTQPELLLSPPASARQRASTPPAFRWQREWAPPPPRWQSVPPDEPRHSAAERALMTIWLLAGIIAVILVIASLNASTDDGLTILAWAASFAGLSLTAGLIHLAVVAVRFEIRKAVDDVRPRAPEARSAQRR